MTDVDFREKPATYGELTHDDLDTTGISIGVRLFTRNQLVSHTSPYAKS